MTLDNEAKREIQHLIRDFKPGDCDLRRRRQNYSIKMGEEVAQMAIEDYAKRSAKPEAAA